MDSAHMLKFMASFIFCISMHFLRQAWMQYVPCVQIVCFYDIVKYVTENTIPVNVFASKLPLLIND